MKGLHLCVKSKPLGVYVVNETLNKYSATHKGRKQSAQRLFSKLDSVMSIYDGFRSPISSGSRGH
jgi:hypothetical protein